MTDEIDDVIPVQDLTQTTEPFIVHAGDIVFIHAGISAADGPIGYAGTYVARREFDVMSEFKLYAEEFPEAGPPNAWDRVQREQFCKWAIYSREILDNRRIAMLFLNKEPEAATAETEPKVAHED